ncbi:hypothetical protein D8B26_001110 [Coccidioides posadasii str. Silveira]|uniref:uncharacterized protein n=1 Tax=Coccidioides posadasii (strain RMSCC 757 / Silveira) TaxID=443226 RepID=UPI001BF0B093|nr:hypothetical protein D8B26_001110 [Coccidioides posadasii str. Silveira]
MSSAFSFGFSGDDIDESENNVEVKDELQHLGQPSHQASSDAAPVLQEATKIELDDILSSLPSQFSYNTLPISDPTLWSYPIPIPRRDVFDIRAQLMAEADSETNSNETLIAGLEAGDITPAVYEGGFKTWESAIDLARTAAERLGPAFEDEVDDLDLIELGAGTAIPSLLLLRLFLQSSPKTTQQTRKINFILADYNAAVLSLVTLPNILLTWYTCCKNPEAESESELQIDSALLDSFRHDLSARGISLSFISGGWSPRFVDLIAPESNAKSLNNTHQTFILASETIYSPTYLRPFAETLTGLLRRRTRPVPGAAQNKARTRALVAAKKVYFGVGGGVDEFLETLKEIGGEDMHTQEVTMVLDQGVVRVVLEITV